MATKRHIKLGDRVTVPWGTDQLVGVVVDVYGSAGQRHVRVRVPILGTAGETLDETEVSLPERYLQPAA